MGKQATPTSTKEESGFSATWKAALRLAKAHKCLGRDVGMFVGACVVIAKFGDFFPKPVAFPQQ